MKIRSKLMPGQKGTKALQQQYGDALVCVRYCYDVRKRRQYKTVEIIVSEKDWSPPPAKFPEGAMVSLKIGAMEKTLQQQVKTLGGRWKPEQKVWHIPYGCIAGTSLEKLIVEDHEKTEQKQKNL